MLLINFATGSVDRAVHERIITALRSQDLMTAQGLLDSFPLEERLSYLNGYEFRGILSIQYIILITNRYRL